MKKLPSNKIDLIVTDPPFAIDFKATKANYNRTKELVLGGYEDILPQNYSQFTYLWIEQCKRILKTSGSMYIFSGYNNLRVILEVLEDFNIHLLNQIIWKYQFGVVTKRKFVTSHYNLLFVCKNKSNYKFYPTARFKNHEKTDEGRSKRYADMEDVWYIKREYWTGKEKTPTKLPGDVIRKILSYSSRKGSMVFDPFMGSGQVAVIAKEMNRKYLGFELVKEYYDFAKKRLKHR